MKVLYLIRGAPGSGKSTLALAMLDGEIVGAHYEADDFFMEPTQDGPRYEWKPELVGAAHKWCQSNVELGMQGNQNIVVSNTLTSRKQCAPYYELAAKYGYVVQEIVLMNPIFQNVHGVPDEKVKQYHERLLHDLREQTYTN
jgi:predicted kinase